VGKFYNHVYFKHDNCIDAFFAVERVSHDESGRAAVVYGCWMIQGIEHFWPATHVQRLGISPKEYNNWRSYEPIGELM
jgi:hypothetical protein